MDCELYKQQIRIVPQTRSYIKYILVALLFFAAVPPLFSATKAKKAFTVVIDPGHGGVDPGALGRRAKEKDINMGVSKALAEMIKEEFPEVNIIFTRKTDVKIPLIRRATIANEAKADLFISIHSNAAKSRKAKGCETFTLGAGSSAEAKAAAMYENEAILLEDNFEETYKGFDPRSSESYIIFELIRGHDMEKSIELAEAVQKGMVKRTNLQNRGVSSAGFLVLHKTVMPSILVEVGFISNPTEEKYIASKAGQKALAKGIFDGFASYYKAHKKQIKNLAGTKAPATSKATAPVAKSTTTKKAGKTPTIKKAVTNNSATGKPIFKVQILTSGSKLKNNDKRLKGVKADYFRENGMYKYTYGETSDYEEIQRTRKNISAKFKEAFVVAFIDGKKVNTKEAIEIYRKNKK